MDLAVLHDRSILGGDESVQPQPAPGRLKEAACSCPLTRSACPLAWCGTTAVEPAALSQAIQHELDCAEHATFGGIDERPERAARANASGLARPVAIEFVLWDEFPRHLV